jgi:MFS family permease
LKRLTAGSFASLSVANYRLYFTGQAVSLIGTWMQTVAQAWLVLELSHSGTVLGIVVAVQLLPVLLLSPYAGVIADRIDKRRLLVANNICSGVLALVLGLLTVTGAVTLGMVFVLAAALGVGRAFTAPVSQSFVSELVGLDLLQNAVSLNNVMLNAARAVGPALAGVMIASVGVGVCFLVNAASFIAVLVALSAIDPASLQASEPVVRARGQVREGVRYVRANPGLLAPLLMMALVGTLAYEFQISLPLMATGPLGGGAGAYGFMTAAMGVGAVIGGLVVNSHLRVGLRTLSVLCLVFGTTIAGAAVAPSLPTELAVLLLVGAASTAFMSTSASTLQLRADPQFRGRVMALWSVAFMGSTPVGGPVIGAACEYVSPRAGLMVGAVACVVCAGLGWLTATRLRAGRQRAGRATVGILGAGRLRPEPEA